MAMWIRLGRSSLEAEAGAGYLGLCSIFHDFSAMESIVCDEICSEQRRYALSISRRV
jgi:hypothetical protein